MGEAKRRLDLTGNTMNKLQPGQGIDADIKNAKQEVCECGCKFFFPVITLFTISPILSSCGQELISQKPAVLCVECHKQLR